MIKLSEKERDVINVMTKGYSNRESAKMLYMSLQTYKWNLARLREKFGCTTTKELISFCYENELVEKTNQKVNGVDPSLN